MQIQQNIEFCYKCINFNKIKKMDEDDYFENIGCAVYCFIFAIIWLLLTFFSHSRFTGFLGFTALWIGGIYIISTILLYITTKFRIKNNSDSTLSKLLHVFAAIIFNLLFFGGYILYANYTFPYWGLESSKGQTIYELITSPHQTTNDYSVYITPYGKCYHRKNCYHIRGHEIYEIKKSNTRRRPCLDCNP